MNARNGGKKVVIATGLVGLALGAAGCSTPPATGYECGAGTQVQDKVCVAVAVAPTQIAQVGTSVVPPPGTPPSGWFTPAAIRLGMVLEKQYDSSGPNAWDPVANPMVFITTVGPGYGGKLGGEVKWPGVVVINAETQKVVKYAAFDLSGDGWTPEKVFEPHGLAVSPDGKWIYVPSGKGATPTSSGSYFLVINAKTLKLDKLLSVPRGRGHHGKSFIDGAGKPRVLLYGWELPAYVLDPTDDNKVVGGADMSDTGMEGYVWQVDPSGKELWGSGRWRNGNIRAEVHGNQVMIVDTATWKLKATIPYAGESTPIWMDFSPDGKFAYVSGGHSSTVLKYDRVAKKVMGISRAGVEGPYGIRLGWDGKSIYAVGKGEGSHNLGQDIGVLDTKRIETSGSAVGQYSTACVRGDHATTHPDSAKNELWLSCNSSFELAVFNMTTNKVTARIPMPSGGSTHSGSFVKYQADFTGVVLSDQNGLHGEARAKQLSLQAP
jgi:DNA-binding beta-propeller fold protein YncE